MARKSLKPQLNQIRAWVRQGRTDAWIAHQLEVSVRELSAFKREHGLAPPDSEGELEAYRDEDELDLRAEDDALIAAALEAEEAADDDEDEDTDDTGDTEDSDDGEDDGEDDERPRRRRRGRRGGRGRRRGGERGGAGRPLEGTFDHGDEGFGLWLDPAIQDDPVYAEHWRGHRPVTVTVESNRIVIRRAGEDADNGDSDDVAA